MSQFTDNYEQQIKDFLAGFGRAMDNSAFYGCQPKREKFFEGGTCPFCHGYGSSHGPEHGFPCGWTCGACGGRGHLEARMLLEWAPYPEGHPNKNTKWERTGWAG